MSSILECIRTVGRGERGRKPLNFDQAFRVMDEYLNAELLNKIELVAAELIAQNIKALALRAENSINWAIVDL
ncbi:glycosyl transferase, partial [Vibrio parahaemolyticus]